MCNPLAYRLTHCLKKAGMQKWQFNAKNEIEHVVPPSTDYEPWQMHS
jgi:hypothetical protein